jgi:phosphatidylinositol alpha-1,6-mannosyltransferase
MTEYGQRVLYLSGPIEPPWTRTDKVLVRGVATHLERYRPRVLTHEGVLSQDPGVETEPAWGPRVAGHTSIGRRLGLFSKLIDLQGISLLHLFWPADRLVASVVRAGSRLNGLPVVHTLVHPPRTTVGIGAGLVGSTIVCLSDETEQALNTEGIRNTVRIPIGIDVGQPVPEGDKAAIRRKYRIPLDQPVVIYAGDYAHDRAARTVAASMPRVLRQIDCHFVMACRIRDEEDALEEQRIQEAIAADGLAEHVTFLNEVKSLRELLSIATVQVFPADHHYEKMELPMVLLEGMAEGVALVVATKPPLTELVHAGVAIGIPPADPMGLAVPVVELLRQPERAKAVGQAGRDLVCERFNIRKVAAQYEELYDEVLARHKVRSSGHFWRLV